MPTSAKPTIQERMAAILDALPAIGKDAFNPGLKFNFRSIDHILNELNPLLGKHGVFLLPEVRDIVMSTRPTRNGEASVAVVTVAYHFTADDGSEVVAVSTGEGQDSGDKSVSKAMTMALKTCLGQTFAISTEDDPDGDGVATQDSARVPHTSAGGESPGAAEPVTPAPAPPPGPSTKLEERRQWCFNEARDLTPDALNTLKQAMAEQGIGMDFSAHTEEQVAWLESKLEPF